MVMIRLRRPHKWIVQSIRISRSIMTSPRIMTGLVLESLSVSKELKSSETEG